MGQMGKAIGVLLTIGVSSGAMVFAGGCADDPKPNQTSSAALHSDVTDVHPIEPAAPAAYQPPLYDNSGLVPTAPQPVTGEPVSMSTTPTLPATPAVTSGTVSEKSTHTVRHGETLFSIAKITYGDGKQWKKIVAANPGVSPSKLKVGQVLVIPQS
jgi:nucleoid-associated protein YgaU